MRFGIDIREISPCGAGKGRYVAELINALQEIDQENEYVLYGGPAGESCDVPPGWQTRMLPYRGLAWHLAVTARLHRDGVDLYLATLSHIVPCITPLPCVMIAYDLAAFAVPEARLPLKVRTVERLLMKRAAMRSAHVAALSESTRDDLNRICGIPIEKIAVVGAGVGENYRPTVRRIADLPAQFLLHVGTMEPRKNIARLIRAYMMLNDSLRNAFPLVIVGKRGWHCEEIDQALRESKAGHRIVMMEHVKDDDLPAIYSQATAFVYPSLYEGFGLPPLEAMACGTPVITSNTSSLPEVVGDAAITVDPRDVKALWGAMRRVLADEDLRDDLRKRGLERARLFSWPDVARRILQVCMKHAADPGKTSSGRRRK